MCIDFNLFLTVAIIAGVEFLILFGTLIAIFTRKKLVFSLVDRIAKDASGKGGKNASGANVKGGKNSTDVDCKTNRWAICIPYFMTMAFVGLAVFLVLYLV